MKPYGVTWSWSVNIFGKNILLAIDNLGGFTIYCPLGVPFLHDFFSIALNINQYII